MATTAPTTEPTALRAGDTWSWRRENLSDYPASVWTLVYYFRNATSKFTVAAVAAADLFAVSVDKTTTAALAAGDYTWLAVVDDGAERHQIGTGRLTVEPDLAVDALYDGRTFARTLLDSVEAALLSKATASQLDLVQAALADRSMQYDNGALMTLRSRLQVEVRREDAARNGVNNARILVRFA